MTKRKLSDLLKEESENIDDSSPKSEPTASKPTQEVESESMSTTSTNGRTTRRAPTKADLQEMVRELKAGLAESQTEVENLQAQLNDKEGYVEELRGYLDKANDLKVELDKAQKAITQLEEENADLRKELAAAKASSKPSSGQSLTQRVPAARPGLVAKAAPGGQNAAYGRRPVAPTVNPTQDGEDFSKQTWLL